VTAPALLRVVAASKTFGRVQALAPTTLEVPAGQTTVLIGPSGSGKSTLLRMMVGLVRPDSGQVLFDGVELGPTTLQEIRRRIGYVVQEGGLFPHLTARGNATLLARHLRWPEARIDARVEALRALARLPADVLDRYPAQLSGGQRQRVGLMRALMMDPELLVLDEPLGALDPLVRAELQDDLLAAFRGFRTSGKSVVMVTHDLDEAAFFGERLVLMREGRVVQEGRLEDLAHAPADPFVTRFLRAQRPRVDLGS
jgi:osmoprotectant transport system ATP-binding protein